MTDRFSQIFIKKSEQKNRESPRGWQLFVCCFSSSSHAELRKAMSNILETLFQASSMQVNGVSLRIQKRIDPEKWMVHKLCVYKKHLIDKENEPWDIPLNKRLEYVRTKQDPATSSKKIGNYGGGLELDLFCFMCECCIWILFPYSEGNSKFGYQWQCVNMYLPHNALKDIQSENNYELLLSLEVQNLLHISYM